MKKNFFISGEWNITCDVCSKKIKAHEAKQRWDGFIVCPDDFEHRHPQDFVKAQIDKISVPFQRPIPTLAFKLMQPLTDTVPVSDSDNNNNYFVYMTGPNSYVDDTYLLDPPAFEIIMNWVRAFADTCTVIDIASITLTTTFADTVALADNIMIGTVFRPMLSDTQAISESGSILNMDYVESGYFLEQYVGTTYTF